MLSAAHASLRYHEIEQAGSAAEPLDFPSPQIRRVSCSSVLALDHLTGQVQRVNNVLVRPMSEVAYLIKRKISQSTYGSLRTCIVLRRRPHDEGGTVLSQFTDTVEWISTDERVAVKASSLDRMRSARRKHVEDPIKEAAALVHVGNYHANILGCIEVLQDDQFLYTIMPFCPGGDLYSRVVGSPKTNAQRKFFKTTTMRRPDEVQARIWFRQLVGALFHLQQKGVCHRDISLENLVLDDNDNVVLIDFGLALRVPYLDDYGGVSDVSDGSCRRLLCNHGLSGNMIYLAPELAEPKKVFDSFAVDLWSAGIVLFVLLIGLAPFECANLADYRYRQINKGRLQELLLSMNFELSGEACDLLQKMLWLDPRKRLTLSQVLSHPWVVGSSSPPVPMDGRDDLIPRRTFSPQQ